MFADLKSFFAKLGGNKVTVALIVLVVGFALFTYSGSKGGYKDTFASSNTVPATLNDTYQNPPIDSGVSASTSGATSAGGYTMKPVANPTDLLPADGNSQWTALNPSAQNGVMMPDLLQAGYHIGLDTIGQTLKNPNLQLRSDPVIAKKDIGPWNLSTYEGDPFRVPLEIGVSPAAA
jgi:hypothetical protein